MKKLLLLITLLSPLVASAFDFNLSWPVSNAQSFAIYKTTDITLPFAQWSPVLQTTNNTAVVHSVEPAAFFVVQPVSDSVGLSWDQSPSSDVTGFFVYYGLAPHYYNNRVDAGNSTRTRITGLTPGATYYFAVTAYDAFGDESDFSAEASNQFLSCTNVNLQNVTQ